VDGSSYHTNKIKYERHHLVPCSYKDTKLLEGRNAGAMVAGVSENFLIRFRKVTKS